MLNILKFLIPTFKKNNKLPVIYALDAETFLALKEYKKALKSIKKAIRKEPQNDMFYSTEALIYKEIKNYNAALKSIDKALEIQPNINILKNIKDSILELKR